jgi:hypothetical protein
MTDQKILDTLSKIECELYYRLDESNDRPKDIEDFHKIIDAALLKWHKITGLTIS